MIYAIRFLFATFVTTLLFGCKDDSKKEKQPTVGTVTAVELDSRLKSVDSLVVVFYKDPYGNDSLRYTRYYTQTSVTDISEITILQQNLGKEFSRLEKRKNCRSEGKIWCFAKSKIFQTLYFSTRCDDCCFIYLIKDGNFYYSPISRDVVSWLEKLKLSSIEPANQGIEE